MSRGYRSKEAADMLKIKIMADEAINQRWRNARYSAGSGTIWGMGGE